VSSPFRGDSLLGVPPKTAYSAVCSHCNRSQCHKLTCSSLAKGRGKEKHKHLALCDSPSLISPQNDLGEGVLHCIMNHSEILMENGEVQAHLLIYTIGCDTENILNLSLLKQ